jgi:hypothetical protein
VQGAAVRLLCSVTVELVSCILTKPLLWVPTAQWLSGAVTVIGAACSYSASVAYLLV